jgi:hypothetical protein
MDRDRTERTDAAAGIAFVVLAVAATVIPGSPPTATDSTRDVRDFLVDERDSLQAATYITGLALIAFLWFLGTLRGHLRAWEGGAGRFTAVAFGSGIALLSVVLAASGLALAPTLHAGELDDSTVRALFDAQVYMFAMAAFPAAGVTAGSAAVILRTGALPRAVGALGVLTSVVSVISGLSLYGESDSFLSIGGAAGFVSFLLFLVWVLVTSIALMRGAPTPAPAAAAAR